MSRQEHYAFPAKKSKSKNQDRYILACLLSHTLSHSLIRICLYYLQSIGYSSIFEKSACRLANGFANLWFGCCGNALFAKPSPDHHTATSCPAGKNQNLGGGAPQNPHKRGRLHGHNLPSRAFRG